MSRPRRVTEVVELKMCGEVIDAEAQALTARIERLIESLPPTGAMVPERFGRKFGDRDAAVAGRIAATGDRQDGWVPLPSQPGNHGRL